MVEWFYLTSGLILLALLMLLYLKKWKKQRQIQQWKKRLNLNIHQNQFNQIYKNIDGFSLSLSARKKNDAMEYVYGEIEFVPFIALLSLIQLDHNSIFYDLGSGTGKAVLACAMTYRLKKYCGIEIFEPLHQAACQQVIKLKRLPDYKTQAQSIYFYNNNFLHHDLSSATVIFVNATALIGESWEKLNQIFDDLENCQTIITTSKTLNSSSYRCIKTTTVEMSWGLVEAYIHQRC